MWSPGTKKRETEEEKNNACTRAMHHALRETGVFNKTIKKFVVTNPKLHDGKPTQYRGLLSPLQEAMDLLARTLPADEKSARALVRKSYAPLWAENLRWAPVRVRHAPLTTAEGLVLTGRQHGSIVHKQLEQFVDVYGSFSKHKGLLNSFRDVVPTPDPCVFAIMNYCGAMRWIPLASEYTVYCPELQIATAADLLVYELESKRLILLEIKTGVPAPPSMETMVASARAGAQKSTQLVHWPPPLNLAPLPLSKFTMHQLQLLGTYMLLRAWGIEIHAAHLLYVSHAGGDTVRTFRLQQRFVRRYMSAVRSVLHHYNHIAAHGRLPVQLPAARRKRSYGEL